MRHTQPTRRVDPAEIVVVDNTIYLPHPEPTDRSDTPVDVQRLDWAYPAPEDGRLHRTDHHTTLESHTGSQGVDHPLPFTANTLPSITERPRRQPVPGVSVGLYAIGQLILAAVIAAGHISPAVGVAVCGLWLLCGALLITAEYRSTQPD